MNSNGLRYVLFDVDNTLYGKETGLLQLVDRRIDAYIRQRFPLPETEIHRMRVHYWQTYGTTLNGLLAEHHVDAEEYLRFIHDVPIESLLQPDAALDQLLAGVKAEKVIFTNAVAIHAQRVLRALGIAHHFPHVSDLLGRGFLSKPDRRAYELSVGRARRRGDRVRLCGRFPGQSAHGA